MDATIIAAPPSTKNEHKARDPEMRQTRKGKQWHFGMKAHIGCDPRGIVHSLATTDAAASDIGQLPKLLHGQEKELFGDQACWSEFHRQCAKVSGIRYRVNRRGTSTKPFTEYQKFINRCRSSSRARGEHASMWSSACGALPRCATAAWPRTRPVSTPPLRWRTCTCCGDG